MKKKILLVCMAIFSLFSLQATLTPITSTAGNDVWYHIKCKPRSTDLNAKWLTGVADNGTDVVTNQVLSLTDDAQYWKVVENAGGIALVNKKFGTYLDADRAYDAVATSIIVCKTNPPTTGLKLVPYVNQVEVYQGNYLVNLASTVTTNIGDPDRTFQFYSAGTGSNFRPINYGINGANVNSSIVFLTDKEINAESLILALVAANNILANASVGINPGQFSSDDIDGLAASIQPAQDKLDGPLLTPAEYQTAADELNFILSSFKSYAVVPKLSSTTDNWYFIQGTRPANTYLSSKGAGQNVGDLNVIPDDSQLWKLVPNTNGTTDGFALQNKLTSEFLNSDVETGTNLATTPTMPNNNLKFIVTDEFANKSLRFLIENTPTSTPVFRLHAGGSSNPMNWTGNAADNCGWLFLDYVEGLKVILASTKVSAEAEYNAAVEGTKIGQYTAATRATFYAAVQAIKALDPATMTEATFKSAMADLAAARTAFTCITDINTLVSPAEADTYRWFRIINKTTAAYAQNLAMSANCPAVPTKFGFETKKADSDAQLFRFVLAGDGLSVQDIINKEAGKYVGASGEKLDAPNTTATFAVTPLDGFSFWIKPTGQNPLHAQATNSVIVNWNSGAGSASAWTFEYVSETAKPVLAAPRTITVSLSNATMGDAVVSSNNASSISTDKMEVVLKATPKTGYFFVNWTDALGQEVSTNSTYIYNGTTDIALTANFVNGYYRPMTRTFSASSPTIQSENRYLTAATVTVGTTTTPLISGVVVSPNPVDVAATANQKLTDAIVDLTATMIELPLGTTTFDLNCVGMKTDATVEDFQWTTQNVFVDWNKDFLFTGAGEAGVESVYGVDGNSPQLIDPAGFNRTITLPVGLAEGYYRMRVIYNEEETWATSIWNGNNIKNGTGYDFTIKYGAPNEVSEFNVNNLNAFVSNNKLRVLNAANGSVRLSDVTGRVISNSKVNANVQDFNMPSTKGIYFVSIQPATGKAITVKVIR